MKAALIAGAAVTSFAVASVAASATSDAALRSHAASRPVALVDLVRPARAAGPEDRATSPAVAADLGEAVETGPVQTMPVPTPQRCSAEPVTAAGLDEAFDDGIDGIVGADYQRAFELDDGGVLWVFQDAFIDLDGDAEPHFVHNAGALQEGMCFERLLVDDGDTRPWIGGTSTRTFERWYWPLDGYQADDDTFVLFVAEMSERGDRYLANATPIATWTVAIDLDDMQPGALAPAADPGDDLYGFEVTTDDEYLYLFAQCHRQFGFSTLGHDECANDVFVARQPVADTEQPLEYWDGETWAPDGTAAANIAPVAGPDGELRGANPMQIERSGDRWIAVTKAGDWWGDTVYFDVAASPEGPWTTTAVIPVDVAGEHDEIASYFVSFVPGDDDGSILAISHNRWSGEYSDDYRPHFTTVSPLTWSTGIIEQVADDVWLPIGAHP